MKISMGEIQQQPVTMLGHFARQSQFPVNRQSIASRSRVMAALPIASHSARIHRRLII